MALWMQGLARRRWALRLLTLASRLGDGWVWLAAIGMLPWVEGALGTLVAMRLFGVCAANLLVYRILKRRIARPRPFRTCSAIAVLVRPLDEFSFPSGHVLHAVACSVLLTAYWPMWAAVLWPFTALVALSRVVLGLHYPSDVVAGAVLGVAASLLGLGFR